MAGRRSLALPDGGQAGRQGVGEGYEWPPRGQVFAAPTPSSTCSQPAWQQPAPELSLYLAGRGGEAGCPGVWCHRPDTLVRRGRGTPLLLLLLLLLPGDKLDG
ncbi:hypothetical protein E2C01_012982 [Portunus trituberculatus]|uniref:Uncharacterized protein n=1 Tax=Portunus trituberculatus TaxID=210409 RepID=A0A5B7DFQ9_PORTR|nr:hypothetical protein [Portunus trituberculatus]